MAGSKAHWKSVSGLPPTSVSFGSSVQSQPAAKAARVKGKDATKEQWLVVEVLAWFQETWIQSAAPPVLTPCKSFNLSGHQLPFCSVGIEHNECKDAEIQGCL